MAISIEEVKKLRDETGISVMQCKKALEEAKGDAEKAKIILQKQSKAAASKKADRELGAGTVEAYVHNTNTVGCMIELSCETDFVAKNEEYKELARNIAMHAAAMNPEFLKVEDIDDNARAKAKDVFLEEVQDKPDELKEKILQGKLDSYFNEKVLLNQSFIKDPEKTIGEMIEAGIQKFGEKIEITNLARFEI